MISVDMYIACEDPLFQYCNHKIDCNVQFTIWTRPQNTCIVLRSANYNKLNDLCNINSKTTRITLLTAIYYWLAFVQQRITR